MRLTFRPFILRFRHIGIGDFDYRHAGYSDADLFTTFATILLIASAASVFFASRRLCEFAKRYNTLQQKTLLRQFAMNPKSWTGK